MAEELLVDRVQAPKLFDRPLVVVDAQVDEDVGELRVAAVALDDEQAGRLLAAPVASGELRRGEAAEEPLGERISHRSLEGLRQGVDGRRRDEDVALRRVARSRAAAGPFVAFGAGEGGGAAVAVDDAQLPGFASFVVGGEPRDDLVGGTPLAEQREPVRPVARIGVRLRRDRADVRLGPRHDGADREELRLHRHAPLRCLEVAGDDREGRDGSPSHT